MLRAGVLYAVFSRRPSALDAWVRAGSAWLDSRGRVQVQLDLLPVDGRLEVRAEPQPTREEERPDG